MKRVKRWVLFKLIRHYYNGITPNDFIDLSKMSESQVENYCLDAGEVWRNQTFQTEMLRMQYKQEKYLATKAQNTDDLIFGWGVLYTISEILSRFEQLAKKAEFKREESRSETVDS